MIQREREEQLPVTLDQQKAHLRITSNAFDQDLMMKLRASIQRAENWMNRILIPSVFTQKEPWSPIVLLAVFDITSIVSVSVDDISLSDTEYGWDGDRQLRLKVNGERVEVVYKAGLAEVEDDIKAAIMMDCGSLFTNPLDSVEQLPKASQNIYNMYKYERR